MRLRLAMSPWWVQALVFGVFFGAFMTVFERVMVGRWWPAALGGVVGGIFFGVFMGLFMSRLQRRVLAGLEAMSLEERRIVVRAAKGGPAPKDSRLRDGARTLVQRQLDEAVRQRRWAPVVLCAAIALYVVEALTRSWWWWLAAGVFLVFLLLTLTAPRRLRRRLTVLQDADRTGRPAP